MERHFKRSLASLDEMSETLRRFFADNDAGTEHLESVILAVEELFTNMLKYGGGTGEIRITVALEDGELSVGLTDFDVDEFDIRQAPEVDIDRPLSERKPGGLGIHLIKKMMDRIEYNYVDRRGTTTFFKKLDG
jgi:anti-sigma regulatory factor (Ser/Thr protein kinase)